MKHKTIICDPIDFDSIFINWQVGEVEDLRRSDQSLLIKDIKHDGDSHYILYKLDPNTIY